MDWRAYQETHGLTEKQQKLATKVRKRELRIANLQTEMERIKVPPPGLCQSVFGKLRLPLRLYVLHAVIVKHGSAGPISVQVVRLTRQVILVRICADMFGLAQAAGMSCLKAQLPGNAVS